MKRIITLIVIITTSTFAWADYSFIVDGIYYYRLEEENSVWVTNDGANTYSGSIVIPSSVTIIEGFIDEKGNDYRHSVTYNVTAIKSYAFENCTSLISVTIPSSVTSIGQGAFDGCSSLTSVTLPNNITNINMHTFQDCSSLTSVTIPNSVTSIESGAFYRCSSLSSITFPEGLTTIEDHAFSNCTSLISVTIPSSVTSIGQGAFVGCSSLTSVILPNTITNVEPETFYYCSSLSSITLPNSVKNIGRYAFEGCTSLTSITIPDSVTSIGGHAFSDCTTLNSVVWNAKNCEDFENWSKVFDNTKITSFIIGDDIEHIPAYLCYYMNHLTSVTIPKNVTSIGENAFGLCSALDAIVWNAKKCMDFDIHTIPFDNISSIVFGDSVEHIPAYLCYYMNHLTSVTIPKNVTSIGENAFGLCSALDAIVWNAKKCMDFDTSQPFNNKNITSFIIGDSVEYIPAYLCYYMNNLTSVTISKSVKRIGEKAFSTSLYSINVDENNINYDSRNNCNAIIETATHTLNFGCTNSAIPNSVTRIGDDAFANCSSLISVAIPNSVISIGNNAFENCSSLTSIAIPNSMINIGRYAFANCSRLDSIYCKAIVPPLLEDYSTFEGVYARMLCVPCKSLEQYQTHEIWGKYPYYSHLQCIDFEDEEKLQSDGLFYRYIVGANNTLVSETLLTNESFNKFITVSVTGDQKWTLDTKYGAKMSGYSDTDQKTYPNEDWLISPAMNLANETSVTLIFNHVFGPKAQIPTTDTQKAQYTIWVSNDFYGDLNDATWTELKGMAYGTKAWEYVSSNVITIPKENLKANCRIAWKYVCDDASATWEIKNVMVKASSNKVEIIASENKYSGDITIPSTILVNNQQYEVVGITDSAFYECSTLSSITIPNSIKYIGQYAFYGCDMLSKTNYEGDIKGWCGIKFGGAYANPMSKSYNFYLNNQEIKDLVIPHSIDSIHESAFDCCASLTSVNIPNSVSYIGEGAFYRCESISEILISKNVTTIKERAFSGCDMLTSIIVENGNPIYDSRENCNAIIETKNNKLIAGCSVTKIPNTITSIGEYAFSYYDLMNSMEIPNSVTSIGDYAFKACNSLSSITIPNGVTTIGLEAFRFCHSLTSVVIPNSVSDIGVAAFHNCKSLITLTLGSGLDNIGAYAFYFCNSLSTIYSHTRTTPTLAKTSFINYDATLYVPCESLVDYKQHEIWGLFSSILCNKNNGSDLENTYSQSSLENHKKFLRNGQLIIVRDGVEYTVMGQEM